MYPSLEQYNQALQHPNLALADPSLKNGEIVKSGLGLPLALCGGFALTYTLNLGSQKYAIRCFHKNSRNIEQRYNLISNRLKLIKSPYFVDFEFQPNGIRVNSINYPIVRMTWAAGLTMGEYLENLYGDRNKIFALISSLNSIGSFLESNNIAHGDIQPGNVMVSSEGKSIKLIDYDGMYVEELKSLGSSEIGHRNFQHPMRNEKCWGPTLDRFSLISLNVSLRALGEQPDLWKRTNSDGDSVLFRTNDYNNPDQSITFKLIGQHVKLKDDLRNFAAICKSNYSEVPSLQDFLLHKNIPQPRILITSAKVNKYYSPYIVLDGSNYDLCFPCVGDVVELIGKVEEVKKGFTKFGKGYIFVNFGWWKEKIVKAAIWPESIEKLSKLPDSSWENEWISVVGLLEPPYHSEKYGYTHLAVNITQSNQMHIIQENEAKFRLESQESINTPRQYSSESYNRKVLEDIKSARISVPNNYSTVQRPISENQSVLTDMKRSIGPSSTQSNKTTITPPQSQSHEPRINKQTSETKKKDSDFSCWVYLAIIALFYILCFLTKI